jgi:hypothetical protein
MPEIVIMGVGIDSPTVTLPMSATKEEIVGALLATCTHDWYAHPNKQEELYLCAHCRETQS